MLKEIAATEPNPEFEGVVEEIKTQEFIILAKLAELGKKI